MKKKELLLRSILTAATLLLLVLLAWQCLDIYIAGNSPANLDENGLYIQPVYRAEEVVTRLSNLRGWATSYLALLATACVLLPGEVRKSPVRPMEPDNRLRLVKKKFKVLPENARAEEALRRKVRVGAGAVVTLCIAMSMLFLLNRDYFTSWDLELVMGRMMAYIIPWLLLAFASAIAAVFICRRSMERELHILKGIPGSDMPVSEAKTAYMGIVRLILYALAVILVVTGIFNGGMRDVLVKAINICTECIGLG